MHDHRLQVNRPLPHKYEVNVSVLGVVEVEPAIGRGEGVGEHHQHTVETKKKDKGDMNQEERLLPRVPHHTLPL